jgi:hypothetical protein
MSDIVIQVISSVLSGGASAATTFAAVFREIQRRLTHIENKIGSQEDPKTGLFLVTERHDETLRKLKREVESWPDDPPAWLLRLIRKTMASNSATFESADIEKIEQRLRTRLEKRIEDLEQELELYVRRGDYDKDLLIRSKELSAIREQTASSNGLLRGIMSALGYIDPEK